MLYPRPSLKNLFAVYLPRFFRVGRQVGIFLGGWVNMHVLECFFINSTKKAYVDGGSHKSKLCILII